MTEVNKSIEQQCTCTVCAECRGSGSVWIAFDGSYLGSARCDDMDELERCEECGGSGIVEQCEYCADKADDFYDEHAPKSASEFI